MLIDKVRKTIKKFGLIEKGDKVIVAVSGGPDSTALLLALNGLKQSHDLKLKIAHLDHMFRPAEDTKKDYEYVLSLSKRLNIPLVYKRIDVPAYAKETGLSPEEAAREKRYGFLIEAAKEARAKKIALGHTFDDQAETVLMRLIRGAGLSGLRGIPVSRRLNGTLVIRPLLEVWRKEVDAYLRSLRIKPMQDATNLMPKFFRNRIRNEVIKFLEKYNPNIKESLARSAQNFFYDYETLAEIVNREFARCAKVKRGSIRIFIRDLKKKRTGLQRGILRKAIETLKGDLRGIDYSHIEDIEDLMKAERGAMDLPGGKIRVTRTRDALVFGGTKAEAALPKVWRRIPVPGATFIPGLKLTFDARFTASRAKRGKPKTTECMDFGKIKEPLYIRTWEKGDRFRPLGMSKEKKLQDFFVDQKVPRESRNSIPLVIAGKKIIWVCGLRLSEDVKISDNTINILKLSYKRRLLRRKGCLESRAKNSP